MVSNETSLIAPMVATQPKPPEKRSFNLINASEGELQALSLQRFGSNTLHSKEVATIIDAQYADIYSIAGEIRPSLEIELFSMLHPSLIGIVNINKVIVQPGLDSIDIGNVYLNLPKTCSTSLMFTMIGDPVVVTSNSGGKITFSTDGVTFATSITLGQNDYKVSRYTLYIAVTPTVLGAFSYEIYVDSIGITRKTIDITGVAVSAMAGELGISSFPKYDFGYITVDTTISITVETYDAANDIYIDTYDGDTGCFEVSADGVSWGTSASKSITGPGSPITFYLKALATPTDPQIPKSTVFNIYEDTILVDHFLTATYNPNSNISELEWLYSFDRRIPGYLGPCLRVGREDGQELDIPFDNNGHIDTVTLAEFAGTDGAFITKWYDQSTYHRFLEFSSDKEQRQYVYTTVLTKGIILGNRFATKLLTPDLSTSPYHTFLIDGLFLDRKTNILVWGDDTGVSIINKSLGLSLDNNVLYYDMGTSKIITDDALSPIGDEARLIVASDRTSATPLVVYIDGTIATLIDNNGVVLSAIEPKKNIYLGKTPYDVESIAVKEIAYWKSYLQESVASPELSYIHTWGAT